MTKFFQGYRPNAVDISSTDQQAITSQPTALRGIHVQVSNSAVIQLKDGSSGSTIARVPANTGAGTWIELGDMPFANGIYQDAGGAATGTITYVYKQFQNETY